MADYSYAVWQRPTGELTLGFGAHRVAVEAELVPMSGARAAAGRASLLLAPTLRWGAAASWGSGWVVHGHRHELRLQRGPHAGRQRSQALGVDWRLRPQLTLSAGHRDLLLAMQVDRPDWTGRARSRYGGYFVGASLIFGWRHSRRGFATARCAGARSLRPAPGTARRAPPA